MTYNVMAWGGNLAFPGGNTTKNDNYTGPARTISLDTNKHSIRVHDGVTMGGHEIGGGVTVSNLLNFAAGTTANLGSFAEGSVVSVSSGAVSAYGLPVTHSIIAGALPTYLALNPSTGVVSGTIPNVSATQTYNFTIQATDGVNTITRACSITILALNDAPVWNTGSALGTITATNVSIQLDATDPEGSALTYTLASGSTLPSGFTLSAAGLIAGTNPNNDNTYNFTVNVSDGTNTVARTFSMTLGSVSGEIVYTTTGTYSWVVPAGVTSIAGVCVSGGCGGGSRYGGKGGAVSYGNNIPVTPGETLTITVGAAGNGSNTTGSGVSTGSLNAGGGSRISRDTTYLVLAAGGNSYAQSVGTYSVGGDGGNGLSQVGTYGTVYNGGGGGGAGGYAITTASVDGGSGNGGNGLNGGAGGGGRDTSPAREITGSTTYGNYSYGSSGRAGGGVGLYGRGSNGAGGANTTAPTYGAGGSGGAAGTSTSGGFYGGGGGGGYTKSVGTISNPANATGDDGGNGAVRIIWGTGRSFPSNAA